MVKKELFILLFISCLHCTCAVYCDLFVSDTTGDDLLGNGTTSFPYKTLEKAFETLSWSGSRFVLCVAGGDYKPRIGLRYISSLSQTLRLVAFVPDVNNTVPARIRGPLFTGVVGNLEIDGFLFEGFSFQYWNNPALQNSTLMIRNCNFTSYVVVQDSISVKIVNSNFESVNFNHRCDLLTSSITFLYCTLSATMVSVKSQIVNLFSSNITGYGSFKMEEVERVLVWATVFKNISSEQGAVVISPSSSIRHTLSILFFEAEFEDITLFVPGSTNYAPAISFTGADSVTGGIKLQFCRFSCIRTLTSKINGIYRDTVPINLGNQHMTLLNVNYSLCSNSYRVSDGALFQM
eukprot:TRINITY_DN8648_c0_g1_i1.p1 TRINITY_DN8648_c0_g1~~TRINITY_DN8648_c0_g1_i1.p1  ORF type:complete len:349 (+),score=21.33 TRINITY_DN8648_c0_g1_i1:120-1166(+)